MRRPAHAKGADLETTAAAPTLPRDSAWERNPRITAFVKDYLASSTRERIPLTARLAFDLFFTAVRAGGRLSDAAPVVRHANEGAPGLVDALFVHEGAWLVFRNDWLDMPSACEKSRGYSEKQRERALTRWEGER